MTMVEPSDDVLLTSVVLRVETLLSVVRARPTFCGAATGAGEVVLRRIGRVGEGRLRLLSRRLITNSLSGVGDTDRVLEKRTDLSDFVGVGVRAARDSSC